MGNSVVGDASVCGDPSINNISFRVLCTSDFPSQQSTNANKPLSTDKFTAARGIFDSRVFTFQSASIICTGEKKRKEKKQVRCLRGPEM